MQVDKWVETGGNLGTTGVKLIAHVMKKPLKFPLRASLAGHSTW